MPHCSTPLPCQLVSGLRKPGNFNVLFSRPIAYLWTKKKQLCFYFLVSWAVPMIASLQPHSLQNTYYNWRGRRVLMPRNVFPSTNWWLAVRSHPFISETHPFTLKLSFPLIFKYWLSFKTLVTLSSTRTTQKQILMLWRRNENPRA